MEDKFSELIGNSERVLITSHASPDPDAVASLLLLGTTLGFNYPDKKITMALEEKPEGLEFLTGYGYIEFRSLIDVASETKPDLIIMVDVGNFNRASRHDGDKLASYVKQNDVGTATIDHHEPLGKDEVDAYINHSAPSASQEVYSLCFTKLGLKKPPGYAQTTMLGLYGDTGGFIYLDPEQSDTFELISQLLSEGADIELIKNKLNQLTSDQMAVISQLAANINHGEDYTYTFLDDKFVDDWPETKSEPASLHRATKVFIDSYIRNIDGRTWGFITYKDTLEVNDTYSVSFRALHGTTDVAKVAATLGGGGHKAAAGAKVQAASVNEAIDKIKAAISQSAL